MKIFNAADKSQEGEETENRQCKLTI